MKFDELIVLFPCQNLEDFPPSGLAAAEAEELLAGWAALWHPALLAAAGRIPAWRRAESPGETLAAKLLVVPAAAESHVPSGLAERVEREGGRLVRGVRGRPAIVAALLAQLDPPSPPFDPELADDFLALGACYLHIELLARRMRYGSTIDEPRFQELTLAAANAATGDDGADQEAARAKLTLAFDVLVEARGRFYPAEVSLVDLTLVAGTTLGSSLRGELAGERRINLLISGATLGEMARREPDSLAALREALERGSAALVGGEFEETELPPLPLESILLQLTAGLAEYERHLGRRPIVFGRRRYGLTPALPQILRQLGFRGAWHVTLDEGRFPQCDGGKTQWEGLDGTAIDALARVPLDASQPASFTLLAEKMGHAMDHDQVATIALAHWPGRASPLYDDLRRMAAYAPVLGKFVLLEHYFAGNEAGGTYSRFMPDQYSSPYLRQAVAENRADPLSRWARHLRRCHVAEMADTLTMLAGMLRHSALPADNSRLEVEQVLACGDAAAETKLDKRLTERQSTALAQFAAALPREKANRAPGYLVVNPASYKRRVLLDMPNLTALPPNEPPVLASEESDGHRRVLVEVPAMGFAWVAAAAERPGRAWSGELIASGETLRNEHCEIQIHPQTGGIQSIHDYRSRGNRLSQQIAFRKHSAKSAAASDAAEPATTSQASLDDQLALSRMVAERIEVTSVSRLYGEITSRGQLLDPAGKRLAGYIQRVQMTLGARLVVVEIELEPEVQPSGDPWQSYYASRFAWADGAVELRRDVHLMSRPTTAARIESPNFIEIEAGGGRTAILPSGLPYHCRMGPRMLDTLLLAPGETARRFRLGIGIDLPHPWTAALDMLCPPLFQEETAAAPTPSRHGWLFHIDARNVAATHWEPLLAEEAARIIGFRVRLLETEGRAGRVKLNCFRAPDSATRTDFLGQPSGELTVEQGRIVLEMGAYEWAQVEARWKP